MDTLEFIDIRIAELRARASYAAQLVMNREMAHEAKMCEAQIKTLSEFALALKMAESLPAKDRLVFASQHAHIWVNGSNPPQLMHTDDKGIDTTLCENHLMGPDATGRCPNCIQPCPIDV